MERNQLTYLPRSIGNLIQLQTLNVKGRGPGTPVHVTLGLLWADPASVLRVLVLGPIEHESSQPPRVTQTVWRVPAAPPGRGLTGRRTDGIDSKAPKTLSFVFRTMGDGWWECGLTGWELFWVSLPTQWGALPHSGVPQVCERGRSYPQFTDVENEAQRAMTCSRPASAVVTEPKF